ncbi:Methyltransferase domain-containing protein [Halobiforma haloterrestris]|uniref:Methyltransferase domain-containing protein n=1 Tax=Natronobacterium haloterrestre TaxID=148448 RepID=A0A1I1JA17_NATHA|nr:class I SAM-dependent methyltransferase [Halobiforma haloterrestris]SFC45449.1 Methyltransferase domain-containing protein [Halobiforma haloterrestris]
MDSGASAYFDDLAEFYDAVHDEGDDVAFYRDLALEADGPVLEVGCGTGRIHLELLRAGVDADGIDVSSDSLAVLREKAAEEGLKPSVREADVTDFDPDREYGLAIVPFRAFLHLLEVDDRLAALERLHDALAPGGRLALNAFAPNFEIICEEYGEWIETDFAVDGREYTHRTVTELVDELEGIARIRTDVRDADGERVVEASNRIALVSKAEFALLFRCSPFSSWEVSGGFDGDPLEDVSQEMVWIAER